jgi:hypothetical protein
MISCRSGRYTEVRMISNIENAKVISIGKKDRRMGEDVKKPHCTVQYKFLKEVNRTDEYFRYYNILKKTVKCQRRWYCIQSTVLFSMLSVFIKIGYSVKIRYKKFLHQTAR